MRAKSADDSLQQSCCSFTFDNRKGADGVFLYDKIVLALLNISTLNRAKPGIFIAPFLLMRGWKETDIGIVLFFNGVAMLLVQTPAGLYVDHTIYKRYLLSTANFVAGLSCLIIIITNSFSLILFAMCMQGVAIAIIFPSIYGITLGMVGSNGIISQVPINETALHCGTAVFALCSAIISFITKSKSFAFIISILTSILCITFTLNMDESKIDHARARGLELSNSSTKLPCSLSMTDNSTHSSSSSSSLQSLSSSCHSHSSHPLNPTDNMTNSCSNNNKYINNINNGIPNYASTCNILSYKDLLNDMYLFAFLISCLLFHFGNAAMLPLLSQLFYLKNSTIGFEFAAMGIIIAQLGMVASASLSGKWILKYGTKYIFICSFIVIPIRGFTVVFLLTYYDHEVALLSTQVLDGIAGGLFGVTSVLITENLTRGTGRFSLVIGMVKTMEALGGSFSNLIGELIAEHSNYQHAFLVLAISSFLPIMVYHLCIPQGTTDLQSGNMNDDHLSIYARVEMSERHFHVGGDSSLPRRHHDNDCTFTGARQLNPLQKAPIYHYALQDNRKTLREESVRSYIEFETVKEQRPVLVVPPNRTPRWRLDE